tara:strand:+ start:4406 stop:5344 length:939 start_codon:yes stop_codon:yes gene_type:complete
MAQNKHNFAHSPTIAAGASTYAGELALPYVHAAVLSAPTLANRTVTILENVRFKAQIPVMANTGLVIAGACDFNSDATTSLTESTLEVTDLMVNLQLCKKNFRTWWQGDMYTINSGVPDDYADALLLYVAGEVQADMESNIWDGNRAAGSPALFNGIFKQFSVNGGAYTTLTKAINTTADVVEGLAEVVASIPANLVGQYEEVKIYVNPITIDVYNIAVGQLGGGYNMSTSVGGQMKFGGYEMVATPGIPSGYYAVGRAKDFAVGIGAADSVELAQAIDMTPLDGSDNYRITMRFAVGTQVPVVANVAMGSK